MACLELPESYPALKTINNAQIIFRIWRYDSLSFCSSRLLYKLEEDFFVRPLEWDRTKDNLYFGEFDPTIYGSESQISEERAKEVIEKLKALQLQPFRISNLIFIDGIIHGAEARFENEKFTGENFPLKFSWDSKPPEGWESLEGWLNETSSFFDSILPASTARMIEEKFRY